MPESTGWVAVWIPSDYITKEEMAEFGRDAIEAARSNGHVQVAIAIPPDRVVVMQRLVVRLPVFIESPDWREARDFADALEERAERSLAN